MVLKNKILALISCCILNANLIEKPVISHDIYKDIGGIAYYASLGVPSGLVAESVLVGVPSAAITTYKNMKENSKSSSKFRKILKNAANKSFKVIKWLSVLPAGWYTFGLVKPAPKGMCSCYKLNYIVGMGAVGTIVLTSWIGQKLTEDKKITIDGKNEEVMK